MYSHQISTSFRFRDIAVLRLQISSYFSVAVYQHYDRR